MHLAIKLKEAPSRSLIHPNYIDIIVPTISGPMPLIVKRSRLVSNGLEHYILLPQEDYTILDNIYTINFPNISAMNQIPISVHRKDIVKAPTHPLSFRELRQDLVLTWAKSSLEDAQNKVEWVKFMIEKVAEIARNEGITANQLFPILQESFNRKDVNLKHNIGSLSMAILAYCQLSGYVADELEVAEFLHCYNMTSTLSKKAKISKTDM